MSRRAATAGPTALMLLCPVGFFQYTLVSDLAAVIGYIRKRVLLGGLAFLPSPTHSDEVHADERPPRIIANISMIPSFNLWSRMR
jgi:hypothetical protein